MRGLWRYRFEELRQSWPAVALVAGLTVFAVSVTLWQASIVSMPPTPEQAQVLRFGSGADYDGDHLLVLVRLRDGSVRQLAISPSDVQFCRVGGSITVLRRAGGRIDIGQSACRTPH